MASAFAHGIEYGVLGKKAGWDEADVNGASRFKRNSWPGFNVRCTSVDNDNNSILHLSNEGGRLEHSVTCEFGGKLFRLP